MGASLIQPCRVSEEGLRVVNLFRRVIPHSRVGHPCITHPFATVQLYCYSFSFDLHVLGAPPAFVLSQDQTLIKVFSEFGPEGHHFNTPTPYLCLLTLFSCQRAKRTRAAQSTSGSLTCQGAVRRSEYREDLSRVSRDLRERSTLYNSGPSDVKTEDDRRSEKFRSASVRSSKAGSSPVKSSQGIRPACIGPPRLGIMSSRSSTGRT